MNTTEAFQYAAPDSPEAELGMAFLQVMLERKTSHHCALNVLLSMYRRIALDYPCCTATGAAATAVVSGQLHAAAVAHMAAQAINAPAPTGQVASEAGTDLDAAPATSTQLH